LPIPPRPPEVAHDETYFVLAGMALLALSASAPEPRKDIQWNNPDGPKIPRTEAPNAKAVVNLLKKHGATH
jgi:hypothetical protein